MSKPARWAFGTLFSREVQKRCSGTCLKRSDPFFSSVWYNALLRSRIMKMNSEYHFSPSNLWNCGCHMTSGCVTPVNPLLTAGKWTYVTYFSLHTAEIGVHHPPWPMTSLQIILIQSIGYLLHRYQKMEPQIQPYHAIRFPQINSNSIIHNNRYNYIRKYRSLFNFHLHFISNLPNLFV